MSATNSRAALPPANELLASRTARDRLNSITLSSSLAGRADQLAIQLASWFASWIA